MYSLPSVAAHAKSHGLVTKKSLGQNFLFDQNITDKIVSYAGSIEDREVIEIGPGPGGLTRSILAKKPKKLIVIEKDERCISLLKEIQIHHNNLDIINDDALEVKISSLGLKNPKIIANLPYNISTLLLCKWLNEIEDIDQLTLMFQKEVANRICAKMNESSYGRLSIIVDLFTIATKCFDISPAAFYPPPKVTSSVVNFIKKDSLPDKEIVQMLEKVTMNAFNQRRKMLRSSLASLISSQDLLKLNIEPSKRAENISLEDFLLIANFLLNRQKTAAKF